MKKVSAKKDVNPLVSVIIPTYNRAAYIKSAIESILNQTYRNFEIIIVDDGSTDHTKDVINAFGKKVNYVYQQNRGNASARNQGILKAKGKYLAFLDSDDIWLKEKLERQVKCMEHNTDYGFVYTGAKLIDEEGKFITTRLLQKGEVMTFDRLYRRNMIISTSIVMIRREFLNDGEAFDESLKQSVDYDLWLRLSKRHPFGCVNEALIKYRVHQNNISANLEGRKKAHLRIFSKSQINEGKTLFQKYLRIAQVYFYIAGLYEDDKRYLEAALHYLKSLCLVPWIGVYYWPNEFNQQRFQRVRRIIKAYQKTYNYFLRHIKHRKKIIKQDKSILIEAQSSMVRSREPFFYINKVNGDIIQKGAQDILLGHKITVENKADEGVYLQWIFDEKKLVVQSDRFGFYPAFYYQNGSEFAISTSIQALLKLGISKELDYEALSVFLRIGFFLGEKTPFKHIKALPPNVYIEWEDGNFRLKGEKPPSKWIKINREDALDQYQSLFRKSMIKRLPQDDNFAVPLSGGRDSRHILLELYALGVRPKFCITYDQYPSRYKNDVTIAKEITDLLGIKHVVINQSQSRFKAEMKRNPLLSFCSDEHAQSMILADYLRGKTKIIFDGIAGDTLSEGQLRKRFYNNFYRTNQLEELAEQVIKYWAGEENEGELKFILNSSLYKKTSYECARAQVLEELKKHTAYPDPLGNFYFWNRTRREIALSPYGLLADAAVVYSPYLDYGLVDFLRSLRLDILEYERGLLHTELIKKFYPQFDRVPYGERIKATQELQNHEAQFADEFLRYCIRERRPHSDLVNSLYVNPNINKDLSDEQLKGRFKLNYRPALYLLQLEDLIHG